MFLHFSNQYYYFLQQHSSNIFSSCMWHCCFYVWHFFQHSFLCIFPCHLMLQFLHKTFLLDNLGYFWKRFLWSHGLQQWKYDPTKWICTCTFLTSIFNTFNHKYSSMNEINSLFMIEVISFAFHTLKKVQEINDTLIKHDSRKKGKK